MLRKLLLIILLQSVCCAVFAEPILVRATALKVTETGWSNCGDDCIPWSSWKIYKIRINEVIKGELKEKKLNVAVLMHASFDLNYLKDWYVIIEPFSEAEFPDSFLKQYDVHYEALDLSTPRQFVCFSSELKDLFNKDDMFTNPYVADYGGNKEYCYPPFGAEK